MRAPDKQLRLRILLRWIPLGFSVTGAGLILSGCPGGADLESAELQIDARSQIEGEFCDAPALVFAGCGVHSGCHMPEGDRPLGGGVDLVSPGVAERLIDESPTYPGLPNCGLEPKWLIDSEAPEESYLWKKLKNTHDPANCGSYMAPGDPLNINELSCVRAWMDWVIAGGDESGGEPGGTTSASGGSEGI